MNISLRFLLNAGLGAAGMYYFDPHRGRERRASLRERLDRGERPMDGTPHDDARRLRAHAPEAHTEFMREVWSPEMRAIGGVAGGTATLYGLGRGGLRGTVLGIAGGLLLVRAITNVEFRRLPGIARDSRSTHADRNPANSDVDNETLARRERAPGSQPGPVH